MSSLQTTPVKLLHLAFYCHKWSIHNASLMHENRSLSRERFSRTRQRLALSHLINLLMNISNVNSACLNRISVLEKAQCISH